MNAKWLLILVALLRSKVNHKVMAEICRREAATHSEGVLVLPWGQAVAAGPSFRLADGWGRGAAVFTLGETWVFLAQTALQKCRAFPLSSCPHPVLVFLCTLPEAATFTRPHRDPLMPF